MLNGLADTPAAKMTVQVASEKLAQALGSATKKVAAAK